MVRALMVVLWVFATLAISATADAWGTTPARKAQIIRHVFGPVHGRDAVRVARCESGPSLDTNARNGQYLGMFQMGRRERARFGHGRTALAQARAAHRYFLISGWSPWTCRP